MEEVAEGRAELDRLARLNERDPASIEISVMGVPPDRESVGRYAEAGADRIILGLEGAADEQDLPEMDRIARQVM